MSSADPWEHRSSNMRCATCMWFVRKTVSVPALGGDPPARAAVSIGRCRRHAPTMAGYPVVFQDDWCGDHKLDENAI